jgi:hypothetical protein
VDLAPVELTAVLRGLVNLSLYPTKTDLFTMTTMVGFLPKNMSGNLAGTIITSL